EGLASLTARYSQKTKNPRNIKLNGTKNQSWLVNSNPWAGRPVQTILSPLRRRFWNGSVRMCPSRPAVPPLRLRYPVRRVARVHILRGLYDDGMTAACQGGCGQPRLSDQIQCSFTRVC